MSKINKENLGYLGLDFQYRLMHQVVVDIKFGESIIDILNPNYFEDTFLRKLAAKIKDNYEQYEAIPDMNNIISILMEDVTDTIDEKMYMDQFEKVRNADGNNSYMIQDKAMKFCKQQELKKSIREIEKIISNGDLDDYHQCEELIRKALESGDTKDDGLDVFNEIASVLDEDFRQPIPTGINGLDSYMDGGLSKSELGVILAPFGVGKTTIITKMANHAKNLGYNVLQIFFEDTPKVIQRKHLACWINLEQEMTLNELSDHKDMVMEMAERRSNEKGVIKLKKFPSDGTTIPHIRQYIKKQTSKGFRPDIILLDYIDCVQSNKTFKESWDAEGNVMRQFETMLAEFNIAGWTAVQGNRSSINADKVDSTMIGGSIKKGQIGHFILSIAKTLEQKESGHATMAILKSRFGQDGIVFDDITFDNGRVVIDMEKENSGMTFTQTEEFKSVKAQNRLTTLMTSAREKLEQNTNNN
jgi:hypothetical protein